METTISITGYGVVFPNNNSHVTPSLGTKSDYQLSHKMNRFASRSTASAIAACEQAFAMANIELDELRENLALYTSQSGFQHSDLDDYDAAFQADPDTTDPINTLWQSESINPFLVIKSLSNNLLGLLSGLWQLKGECAAFVRDEVGSAAALEEARFHIQQGLCDRALVVISGTNKDDITLSADNSQQKPSTGAVALLLENTHIAVAAGRQPLAQLTQLTSGYQKTKQQQYDVDRVVDSVTQDHFYPGESGQAWGGIVLNIAQAIHLIKQFSIEPAIRVTSKDSQGFSASALIVRNK